ncbi:hypothetical protein SAMN04487948_101190 [Halogranum amylolyticum]|uniref:Uncharacterized protein n=1 Tax=Halogranum amylolyticum TaxID=660520 RepID=A0A1H8MYR6_9EURY|nr:hypothetical protein [Halogranum amylolyticum]SEO22452.1 hypothetical protein SAMN04487948_101190 [Halogranum amylolyticum]
MKDDEIKPPKKADQYEYLDSTTEVVFMVEDGKVLTFREYPNVEAFERAAETGEYAGVNQGVKELPDIEAFRDLDI